MNDTYQTSLIERLADGEYAREYFNAALGDFDADSKDLGHEIAFLTNALDNLIGTYSDKAVENQSPEVKFTSFLTFYLRGAIFHWSDNYNDALSHLERALEFSSSASEEEKVTTKISDIQAKQSDIQAKKEREERQFAQQLRDVAEFNSVGKAHNTAYA